MSYYFFLNTLFLRFFSIRQVKVSRVSDYIYTPDRRSSRSGIFHFNRREEHDRDRRELNWRRLLRRNYK